jgi:hypothetical protein
MNMRQQPNNSNAIDLNPDLLARLKAGDLVV